MPRFEVVGINKKTGCESTRIYEAIDQEDVIMAAASDGTIVEVDKIRQVPDLSDLPATESQNKWLTKWLPLCILVFAVLIPVYYQIHNHNLLNAYNLHNAPLRDALKSCETYGIIEADVYYEGILNSDIIVFDLKGGGSDIARRIDPVHLLLQFASKLELYSVNRVILARNKQYVFFLYTSDLKKLADSYAEGGRGWAFDHLAENCYTMSGSHAYNEWTGGWLGVLQKQMEDLNDFIKTWTGY